MPDLPPLATSTDYVARYGDLPAGFTETQVNTLLTDVSDQVREAAGWQQISLVTDDTVTLLGNGRGGMTLPQQPVVDVTAIDGLTTAGWEWDGHTLTRLDGYLWDGAVTVTYSHGYATIPSWLVGICCQAVRRHLTNNEGLRAESSQIDDFTRSKTYATETVNVGALLTDEERVRIRGAFVGQVGVISL